MLFGAAAARREAEQDGIGDELGPGDTVRAALDLRQPAEIVPGGFNLEFVVLHRLLAEVAGKLRGATFSPPVEFPSGESALSLDLAPEAQRVGDLAAGAVIEAQILLVGARLVERFAVEHEFQQSGVIARRLDYLEVGPRAERLRRARRLSPKHAPERPHGTHHQADLSHFVCSRRSTRWYAQATPNSTSPSASMATMR